MSRELFEAANAKIRRFLIPNKAPGQYPLRGKVYCGYCAHAMNRTNGRWFVCPYRKGYGDLGCTGLSIRVSELEQIVFDSIRCQMTAALGMDVETSDFEVQSCKQAELEKQLQSIRQRKRELYERFVAGEISQEEYKTAKQRCDHDAQMLQNTLRMLAARQQEIQENLEASVRYNALREEVLSSGSLTQAIAEKLIKKVTVYHDHQIEIEYTVQDFLKDGCGTGMEPAE